MLSDKSLLRAIIPLGAILLLDAMSFGLVMPELGPLFLGPSALLPSGTSITVRHMLYSITIALPLFAMVFGGPLIGSLSDHLGRKKTLMLSLLGISLCCCLSGIGIAIGSLFLLLASRGMIGFLNSNESIAQAAIADLSQSENKAINMSVATLAGTVGFIIGPILGGYFSDHSVFHWVNFQTPFYIAAGLSIISAFLLQILFQETSVQRTTRKLRWQESFENLIFAFADKRIKKIAALYLCMEFAWGLYFQTVSLFLVVRHGFSTRQIGGFMTYIAICFMLTLLTIMRWLHKRLSYMQIVKIGMILIAVGGTLTALSHTTLLLLVAVIPITVGVGVSYNTLLALFSDAVGKDEQGKVMGISIAIVSVAWIMAALLSGVLTNITLSTPYYLIALVGVIGWFILARDKLVAKHT